MRFPKPWYREPRGLWYVTLGGKQHNLGADREQAFARVNGGPKVRRGAWRSKSAAPF